MLKDQYHNMKLKIFVKLKTSNTGKSISWYYNTTQQTKQRIYNQYTGRHSNNTKPVSCNEVVKPEAQNLPKA